MLVVISTFILLTAGIAGAEKSAEEQVPALEINWEKVASGVDCAYVQPGLFNSVQSISIVRIKNGRRTLEVVNDPAESADSTSAMAQKHGAIAAINGSYFNVMALTPTTFTKDNGVQVGHTTPAELFRVESVLALKNGKAFMFRSDTASYVAKAKKYKEALAAGPLLLADGKPARDSWSNNSFYAKRHPRSFVGADGKYIYLVVVDGRFPGRGDGASIPELVQIAQMLGCRDAINLDGGGSSTLWVKGKGVLNHPYDNRKFDHNGQRVVPNIVIVK